MFNCDSYTGVTCVDGGCPDALAEEYSDYGILIQIVPSVLIIEDARIVILIVNHVVLYMIRIFSGY